MPIKDDISSKFSQFTRMSKEAFLLILLEYFYHYFRTLFLPLLFISFFNFNIKRFILLLLIWIGFTLLSSIRKYFFTYFRITDNKLIIQNKFISKKLSVIPIKNIHSIKTYRNVFYQVVDMTKVGIDTISHKTEEYNLYFNNEDFIQFLSIINEYRDEKIVVENHANHKSEETSTDNDLRIKLSTKQIILGAAIQNHIKGVVPLFAAIYYLYEKMDDMINKHLNEVADFIESWTEKVAWQEAILLFSISYIIIAAIWIAVTMVRKYALEVELKPNRISICSGLFNRISSDMDKDKIVAIKIKKNFFEYLTHTETVTFSQAAYTQEKKSAKNALTIYGWNESHSLKNWWFGTKNIPEMFTWIKSGSGLFWYVLLTRGVFFSLAVGLSVYMINPAFTLIFLLPTIAMLLGLAYLIKKHSAIGLTTDNLIVSTGKLAKIRTYIPINKVESVKISQTYLQKRFSHTAKLSIQTQEDTYVIRSLPYKETRQLADLIIYLIENHYIVAP